MDDIHCHHKRPWIETKDDSCRNLIIVGRDIHRLIHATNEKVIKNLFQLLNLSNTGLTQLNQLCELVGNSPLSKENLNLSFLISETNYNGNPNYTFRKLSGVVVA